MSWRPTKQIGVGDVQISPLARKYVNLVLDSKRITYGKFIARFEREIARLHQVKYAIFCNSGTSALQVSLHALKKLHGWQDGDEVIVPALTFVATVNIVLQNHLKPIFVDVEPDYFMLDPQRIAAKITHKTRALIPVHIGGQPADMAPIMKLAKKHDLKIIEDACETMFAKYRGAPVGSFGDYACFSTYAAHTLVTGVGGFICTNSSTLAVKAKSLVNHGRDGIYLAIDDDRVASQQQLFQIVDRRFKFTDIGYSYRATEFEGALGLAQIRNWQKIVTARQQNAAYLTAGLRDLSQYLELPKVRPGADHIFMFYPLVVKNREVRRQQLTFFLEKNLIETRYLLPLLSQPIYRELFGDIEGKYPVAQNIGTHGFYIGCHPGLSKRELDYVVFKFHEYFRQQKLE
ncbi:hypothetical protein A3A59_06220 [Candidatus Gottesmanbacteria bacterium RIFCSPLOWO2_01_FULL_42_10]|nr:MAG: hypothetical protein A3A59_06220 [Candidatus Gottesmanbacteria bacterium RIFCSPLOWO2_01_FULL_42_10]